MVSVMAACSGAALLLLALGALRRSTATSPEQQAWQRYCNALARFGVNRQAWEGPFDFAARVAASRPDLGALTHEAAGHFADLRYGTGQPGQLQALKNCTQRLAALRRKPL